MKYDFIFFDMVYDKPYDGTTLRSKGLGGTEATVIRVAEALALKGRTVSVMQRGRATQKISRGVTYLPATAMQSSTADRIVSLRDASTMPFLSKRAHYKSKLILWLHDLQMGSTGIGPQSPMLSEIKPTIVTAKHE